MFIGDVQDIDTCQEKTYTCIHNAENGSGRAIGNYLVITLERTSGRFIEAIRRKMLILYGEGIPEITLKSYSLKSQSDH